jgi:hypothetical protein
VTRNVVYDWTIPGAPEYGLAALLDLRQTAGFQFADNDLSQPAGGFVIGLLASAQSETGQVFGRNRYFTTNPLSLQFYYGTTYESWLIRTEEPWSHFGTLSYPDPARSVATYMASLGMTPTLEAFLTRVRAQDRKNWDDRFAAYDVNRYIRVGFGVARRGCRADMNDDGVVNIVDLTAYQNALAAGLPQADVDLDGAVTPLDAMLYQGIFLAGCP